MYSLNDKIGEFFLNYNLNQFKNTYCDYEYKI